VNRAGTRLLAVIFVVMLGAALLLERARQGDAISVAVVTALPEVFPGVRMADITRIEVEAVRVKKRYIFERQLADWKITDQDGKPAQIEIAQVTRMLQVLSTLRYNRSWEGMDVSEFGLENGGYFTVSFVAKQPYSMRVGEINSAQTGVYIQRGGESTVLLVPREPIINLLLMFSVPTDPPQ
jgi:hypothetical protein